MDGADLPCSISGLRSFHLPGNSVAESDWADDLSTTLPLTPFGKHMGRSGKHRLVVGFSGSSGAPLGIEFLRAMQEFPNWETHLILSEGAERTLELEANSSLTEVQALATQCYELHDVAASISSGTFKTAGMVVIPCSMKTLAGIAHGFSDTLLLRAADVTLKERRKLVMVTRETPLSPIHLGNMLALANLGAVIMPPMLSYYNRPETVEDMTRHIVGKVLDCFDLDISGFRRWSGPAASGSDQRQHAEKLAVDRVEQ